ncbi:MAG: CcmD family protein [Cryomorphaceae bacterium]|nr:CcmD family protein [Cryomorphaceae bacterium]
MKSSIVMGLTLLTSTFASAQQTTSPLEGTFFGSGKVYVVVAVSSIILAGIFIYLVRMDRSITKLEDEMKSK